MSRVEQPLTREALELDARRMSPARRANEHE